MERPTKRQKVDAAGLISVSEEMEKALRALTPDNVAERTPAVHMMFLDLKDSNRRLHELTDQNMVIAQQKSDKLHELMLKLQNLQYERGHYLREIKDCQNFGAQELAELDLASADEVLKEKQSLIEDPHELMLGRLNFELEKRKWGEDKVAELHARRHLLIADSAKKRAFIDKLGERVAGVTAAAQEVLDFVSELPPNNVLREQSSPHQSSPQPSSFYILQSLCPTPPPTLLPEIYLPTPLFYLYSHINGYIEAGKESQGISVTVEGDCNRARDYVELDSEEWAIHPLQLKWTIYSEGIADLNVVTASAETDGLGTTATRTLNLGDIILQGLLPNDHGDLAPNTDYSPHIHGYAYRWLQIICGLEATFRPLNAFLIDVIEGIQYRLKAEKALQAQIEGLSKGRIPVDIKTRLPIRNFTSLSAFTEVNPVEDQSAINDTARPTKAATPSTVRRIADEPEEGEIEDDSGATTAASPVRLGPATEVGPSLPSESGSYPELSRNRYFKAILNCDKEEYKAFVCIQPCYPRVAPIFLIYSTAAIPPNTKVGTLFKSTFGLFNDDNKNAAKDDLAMDVEEGEAENIQTSTPSQIKITGIVSRPHKAKVVPPALLPFVAMTEYTRLSVSNPSHHHHRHHAEESIRSSRKGKTNEKEPKAEVPETGSAADETVEAGDQDVGLERLGPESAGTTQSLLNISGGSLVVPEDDLQFDLNIWDQLNSHCEDFLPDSRENTLFHILSYQIRKFKMCLDLHFEISKKGTECAVGKVLGRPVRGRDRHMAFDKQTW